MIKILTGGGFGDAAMSIGKLYSKHAPFNVELDKIHLTHVEVPGDLLSIIRKFYITQGINIEVKQIPSWGWRDLNRDKFDFYLGTHWPKYNVGDETTWEINPFPPLKYNLIDDVETVVSIGGGRKGSPYPRQYSIDEIEYIDNNLSNVIFTGTTTDQKYIDYTYKNISLINKTTIPEFIDYICSCKNFIGHLGFPLILAAMAKKVCFSPKPTQNPAHGFGGWSYRIHPEWNVTEIVNVRDIKL